MGRLAGGGQGDVRHLVGGVHHRPGGCKVQKSTSSFKPTPQPYADVDEDTTDLVSAVESSPSASPLANDLRAGGPGGEGGAGGIPGT